MIVLPVLVDQFGGSEVLVGISRADENERGLVLESLGGDSVLDRGGGVADAPVNGGGQGGLRAAARASMTGLCRAFSALDRRGQVVGHHVVLRDLPIRGALGVLGAGICHVLQVADRLRGAASLARTQVSTCSQCR